MNIYWISWYQPKDACLPASYEPNQSILGWWVTGIRINDNAETICALVYAESEDDARRAVLHECPNVDEWRFCEKRDSVDLSNRFPLADWMIDRLLQP